MDKNRARSILRKARENSPQPTVLDNNQLFEAAKALIPVNMSKLSDNALSPGLFNYIWYNLEEVAVALEFAVLSGLKISKIEEAKHYYSLITSLFDDKTSCRVSFLNGLIMEAEEKFEEAKTLYSSLLDKLDQTLPIYMVVEY